MKIIAVHLRVLIVIFLLNIVNLFARFYLERFRDRTNLKASLTMVAVQFTQETLSQSVCVYVHTEYMLHNIQIYSGDVGTANPVNLCSKANT